MSEWGRGYSSELLLHRGFGFAEVGGEGKEEGLDLLHRDKGKYSTIIDYNIQR